MNTQRRCIFWLFVDMVVVIDVGLEMWLVFYYGIDLLVFVVYLLVVICEGWELLVEYYGYYAEIV